MCRKKNKLKMLIFVSILLGLFVLSIPISMAGPEKPIKIGFISNTTGPISALGLDTVKGMTLAAEEINRKGGVLGRQIEVILVDSESSVAKAATIAKRLIYEDKVIAIIGPEGTGLAHVVALVCEKKGILQIANPPTRAIWEGKKFVFSGTFQNIHYAKATASIIMDYLKLENIGIIRDGREYSVNATKQLIKVLKDRGEKTKVVGVEKYTSDSMDVTPQVMNIKNAGAKGVVLIGPLPNVALKNIREMGWDVPIIVSPATTSERFLKLAGSKHAEGLIGTTFRGAGMEPEYQPPELREMFKLYKEKYGTDPTLFSIIGWDSLQLFVQVVKIAKSDDPNKIRDALENIKGFRTAAGEVNMSPTDHSGRSVKDVGIVIAYGGSWVGLPWVPRE